MNIPGRLYVLLLVFVSFISSATAQTLASAKATTDATRITIGDQVRLFLQASHHQRAEKLLWPVIPDTFNHLEILERSKIDTSVQNEIVTYKQKLLVTGFDSGAFYIPSFSFLVTTTNGAVYTIRTDSVELDVSTVPVDTAKPFKPIKEIIEVKTSWRDYIWLIAGCILFLGLAAFVVVYFIRNKKTPISFTPKAPRENLQEEMLRLLSELDGQQLWQQDRVKEYYIALTDILRGYIERRFHTPALELTSGELLQKVRNHPDMNKHYDRLADVLYTADLAKFAKAKPMPQEHTACMQSTREFIVATPVVLTENTPQNS